MMTAYDIVLIYHALINKYLMEQNEIKPEKPTKEYEKLKKQKIEELETTLNNFKNTKVKFWE